jgi:hypothetical protein
MCVCDVLRLGLCIQGRDYEQGQPDQVSVSWISCASSSVSHDGIWSPLQERSPGMVVGYGMQSYFMFAMCYYSLLSWQKVLRSTVMYVG